MNKLWKKRLVNATWTAFGVLCVVVLIAAGNKKDKEACKGVTVEINGANNHFFVDEKDVIEMVNATGRINGALLESINLRVLEDRLKSNIWISNADLFFDNNNVLNVRVEENEPVARLFTVGGSSFYIDSACMRLPLSDKVTARVPMVTGFPANVQKLSAPDSALLASVKNLAMVVNSDEFWKAQVAQVDITEIGFEIYPTIGNHVVVIGKEENFKEKLDKVFSFYKQVWVKTGLEKYEKVDVRYKGQVVATKRGGGIQTVDSAKARQAWEKLVTDVKKLNEDNKEKAPEALDLVITDTIPKAAIETENEIEVVGNKEKKEVKKRLPEPAKALPLNKSAKKQIIETKPKNIKKVPKALMVKPGENKNN